MPASEARIQANRQNALRSTGPKTAEGKAISRQNGLKHGLTGSGVVLKAEDASAVEERNNILQAELDPKSAIGKILVRQMATLSIRMERSSEQETASIARRVRHAQDDFDQSRLDEVEQLFDRLKQEPRRIVRKLENSPEGVERLILAWLELREDLAQGNRPVWTPWHCERALNLAGLRSEEASGSRILALSKATWGDFSSLPDGTEFDDERRSRYSKLLLIERIDEEITALEAHSETLDLEMIELDRRDAPKLALFDPSKEASLARRYEAEASRGFYKALKELRQVEAEAAERPAPMASPEPEKICDPLASSWERPRPTPRDPQPQPECNRPGTNPAPIHHNDPVGTASGVELNC
jgi:hypothetical protein